MIYSISIRTIPRARSGNELYEITFISDTPITKDTIPVGTLVPIESILTSADYIFAQTVELQIHRPVHTSRTLTGTAVIIPGYEEERIVVRGPLVKNKVEALAKGYFGRIDEKH